MAVVGGMGWNFGKGGMGRNFGMGGMGQKNAAHQKNGMSLNVLLFNYTL